MTTNSLFNEAIYLTENSEVAKIQFLSACFLLEFFE